MMFGRKYKNVATWLESTRTTRRGLAIPTRWYTLPEAIDTLRKRRKSDQWTFQAVFNLNIDPSVPGHAIYGAVDVPHSFGYSLNRTRPVLALTPDPELAEQALGVGAGRAGDLVSEIRNQSIPLRNYDIIVATKDMRRILTAKQSGIASRLKKFNLTPSLENKTLVKHADFIDAVEKYVHFKRLQWKTDLRGITTVPLGRILMSTDHVMENFDNVLKELYTMRPFDFGTGGRGRPKNKGKFVLKLFMKNSEGKALPIDLSTVPTCEHYGQGPPPYYTYDNLPQGVEFRTRAADDIIKPRVPLKANGHPVLPILIKNVNQ